jgi:hypothetical protein
MGSRTFEYKYSWYYPSLQVVAYGPTYKSLLLDSAAAPQPALSVPVESGQPPLGTGLPTKLMKGKPMELILIILLLVLLFGGGFGYYRGGYYRQGGPVGIGGILGLVLVVLVIGWLVHGHIGGLYL